MKRFLTALCALILPIALCAGPLLSSVTVEEEEIVFRLAGIDTGKVFLVGDFNGWNPTMDLMVQKEGGFQLRLYLLPGIYRYRFIVNGVSKADPDNPCLDSEGNSCFTLAERDGALEIVAAGHARAQGTFERTEVAPTAKAIVSAAGGRAFLFSTGSLTGSIDERIGVDLSVGCTQEYHEGEPPRGQAFLLRSSASYQSDRGRLTAFSRSPAAIEPGDPLGLFGLVGPYGYPLGLFSRGLEFDGRLPLGVDAWLLYASRISGYRSGLEGIASSSDLFSRRDLVDSDLMGMKVQAKLGSFGVRYLFRQDRRPKEGVWQFPSFGSDLFRGFERARVQGFWLSLTGDASVTLEGELLFGRNFLSATERLAEGGAAHRDVSLEGIWEHGHRMYVGVSHTGEMFRSRLSLIETTLDGNRELRDGRPEGSRTALDGMLSCKRGALSIDMTGRIEQYSASNTGAIFWLSRTNFWLDGDELSYDLVPFLSSTELYEARFACAWKYEPLGELPWGKGLRFSMTQRGGAGHERPLFREILLSNGVAVERRVTFFLDMRAASYQYANMKRDFVDAFLSVHGSITSSLWCACGVGVNPYAFDRWSYAFSDHGRAEYIAERGIPSDLAADGEAGSVNALIGAEEALSEDWTVTFEAGFTF